VIRAFLGERFVPSGAAYYRAALAHRDPEAALPPPSPMRCVPSRPPAPSTLPPLTIPPNTRHQFSTHDGAPRCPRDQADRGGHRGVPGRQRSHSKIRAARRATADVKPASSSACRTCGLEGHRHVGHQWSTIPSGRGPRLQLRAVGEQGCRSRRFTIIGRALRGMPEPDDHLLGDARARMKEIGAAIGIATDGDADRFGIVTATNLHPAQLHHRSAVDYLVETRGCATAWPRAWRPPPDQRRRDHHKVQLMRRRWGSSTLAS